MKVLILYNKLFDYRIPIFNLLGDKVDLTVAYCYGKEPKENLNFKTIKLAEPKKFGPIYWHKENIKKLCDGYDAVIAIGGVNWLKYSTLPWRRRKFKVLFWTIGVSASYTKGFDQVRHWDWLRDIFYKSADAMIFYTDYPVKKNLKRGYNAEKMFVANNTVQVLPPKDEQVGKDSILFIGTLYREKGLQLLLDAYKEAKNRNKSLPLLNIIGGGEELPFITEWVEANGLGDNIKILGPIYDKSIKRDYFARALACVSPKQAGLSVLESLGYGVPFITMTNAITGGEIFNITNNETGVLLNESSELVDALLDISSNPDKYIRMGENARAYYLKDRQPEVMANGLFNAIKYVVNEASK